MSSRVSIPGERYRWAIRRAGLDVDDYVRRRPEVSAWMDGTGSPTVRQLEGFARSVSVPFGFLLMDEAPEEAMPFPVFRGPAVVWGKSET